MLSIDDIQGLAQSLGQDLIKKGYHRPECAIWIKETGEIVINLQASSTPKGYGGVSQFARAQGLDIDAAMAEAQVELDKIPSNDPAILLRQKFEDLKTEAKLHGVTL